MKSEENKAFDKLAKRQGAWGGGFKAKQAMAADKFFAAEERKVGDRYGYVPKLHPSEWIGEPAQECPNLKNCEGACFQCEYFTAETGKTEYPAPQPVQVLTDVIKAAAQVLEFIEIEHRPPVRDPLEVGHMVRVRLHALADLHDAIAAHNIDEQRALDAIMREAQPAQPQQDESDLLTIAYQSGFYDGKKATLAQPAQEPVAYVTGMSFGRFIVEPLNRAMVLPVGMALYSSPQGNT